MLVEPSPPDNSNKKRRSQYFELLKDDPLVSKTVRVVADSPTEGLVGQVRLVRAHNDWTKYLLLLGGTSASERFGGCFKPPPRTSISIWRTTRPQPPLYTRAWPHLAGGVEAGHVGENNRFCDEMRSAHRVYSHLERQPEALHIASSRTKPNGRGEHRFLRLPLPWVPRGEGNRRASSH